MESPELLPLNIRAALFKDALDEYAYGIEGAAGSIWSSMQLYGKPDRANSWEQIRVRELTGQNFAADDIWMSMKMWGFPDRVDHEGQVWGRYWKKPDSILDIEHPL